MNQAEKENPMKTLSCDLCDAEFTADSFENWMQQMQPHYMSDHADFMEANKDKPKEEAMKWMADNRARFDAL